MTACLRRCALMLMLLAVALPACVPAAAQALQLPAPPAAHFAPQPGARLPLDAVLRDQTGLAGPLGRQFGSVPVVLVPVYYTCRNLCTTLFEGVLQALSLSGLPARAYRLVGVSVDPHDGPARAAEKARAYAGLLPGGAADLAMLTGDAQALARVEAALGYRAVPDPKSPELAHAAGFVVADSTGRVTRYFSGVRFDPAAVRAAVEDADAGEVDSASFADRVILLCAHFAPTSGIHDVAAMTAVRTAALLVLALLVGWIWHRRRNGPRPGAGGTA
jgi:protein SCO1/2